MAAVLLKASSCQRRSSGWTEPALTLRTLPPDAHPASWTDKAVDFEAFTQLKFEARGHLTRTRFGVGGRQLNASTRLRWGGVDPRGLRSPPGVRDGGCVPGRAQRQGAARLGRGAHAGRRRLQSPPRRRVGVGRAARLGLGYQTRHRTSGCMGVPGAQWNASAKAAKFCREPSTLRTDGGGLSRRRPGRGWGRGGVEATCLYFRGLWTSVLMDWTANSGR